MFGYGSLAVILALYLAASGYDGAAIGLLLSLTLVGDTLLRLYVVVGLVLIPVFLSVSPAVEVPPVDTSIARRLGLHRSRGIVLRLSLLFGLDAFAGGFVIQSLIALWFHTRFGVPEPVLGA